MSSETDGKPSWKVVGHFTYSEIELPDGTHLRVKGANLSDQEIADAISDPLGIRAVNLQRPSCATASGFWQNIRKVAGPAFFLLAFLWTGVPDNWDGREIGFCFGGKPIPDSELAAQLGISVHTLSAWRRRLQTARMLYSVLSPGLGRTYAFGDEFGVLKNEGPQQMMGRAPESLQ